MLMFSVLLMPQLIYRGPDNLLILGHIVWPEDREGSDIASNAPKNLRRVSCLFICSLLLQNSASTGRSRWAAPIWRLNFCSRIGLFLSSPCSSQPSPRPGTRATHNTFHLSLSRISRHIVIHLLAIFNLCNYTPCSQYHWANARSCTYSMKRRFVTGLFLPTFLCQRYAQDSSVTRQSFYVGPKSK